MPDYEVTVRYTISWTGIVEVKARDEDGATEKVKNLFGSIQSDNDFSNKVHKNGGNSAELDSEEFEVEDVNEA